MSQGNLPTNLPALRINRGKGCICWDKTGQRYIDYICGYGPVIIGHADDVVNQAVIEQLERGLLFAAESDLFDALHERLTGLFPDTRVMRCLKTGSEAVTAAIRLARARTRRTKIVRCGFHGWHDHVVSPFLSWHLFEVDRVPPEPVAGLPTYHSDGVLVWDGDDLNKLSELFEQNRGEIAALILDPVQLRNPILDILRAIRELTHRHDSLLILDELKTGFRVSLSGVQGHYGVWADIVLVGKAIANGFPLAVVLAPEWARPLSRTARLKGTFNAELVSVAAAIATTDILARPGIIEGLAKMGQRFIDGINVVVTDLGLTQHIQAVPYRWPCMPYIWFRSDSEVAGSLKQPFYTSMTSAGHLLLADHMNFMMVAHTEDDVDQTVGAAEQILSGLLGRARGADVPVTAAVRGPNLLRPTHDKLG